MATFQLSSASSASTLSSGKLPSFNQFVSSLEHMSSHERQRQQSYARTTEPSARLISPLHRTPLPAPPQRSSFAHILNPATKEPRQPYMVSPVPPVSPMKPPQTPRDAYEMRQGLSVGMKPLQPRGQIPGPRPSREITLRNLTFEHDLTLAGKPRKRSAQACQRCRDMKIKCRVSGTGCITCLRQGLECAFEPAKNGLRQRKGKRAKEAEAANNADGGYASATDAGAEQGTIKSPPAKRLRTADRQRHVDIDDSNRTDTSSAMHLGSRAHMPDANAMIEPNRRYTTLERDQQFQYRPRSRDGSDVQMSRCHSEHDRGACSGSCSCSIRRLRRTQQSEFIRYC
jgi:hypothetical protein